MQGHFPQETLQRFLRAELDRRENLEVVRHLLSRCPCCLDAMQAADRRAGLRLVGGIGAPPGPPLAAPDGIAMG